jgi:GT2 family glycosyltransferase
MDRAIGSRPNNRYHAMITAASQKEPTRNQPEPPSGPAAPVRPMEALVESKMLPSAPPLVCAYVITYDGKKFLERCFRTLQQHTDYANFRLFLVDNGSSDGSGDYVRENFPSVEVLRVFPNAGYTRAANEAVKHARSQGAKYVALLNDDIEILHSHWLREAVGQAERDPSIGIVGFTEPVSDAEQKSKPDENLAGVDYLDGFAMVMPLELFDRIGMFDEVYFVVGDEDDLGARAQAAGYKLVRLGVPIYHLGGGTNQNYSLRTAFLQMRNGIRFCIKNRRPTRALLRAVRILDVACNPWPLTFDAGDAAHRRMRNTGNVFVNAWLWLRAVLWNVVRMPQTIAIRQAERRQIRAALAGRQSAAASIRTPVTAGSARGPSPEL